LMAPLLSSQQISPGKYYVLVSLAVSPFFIKKKSHDIINVKK